MPIVISVGYQELNTGKLQFAFPIYKVLHTPNTTGKKQRKLGISLEMCAMSNKQRKLKKYVCGLHGNKQQKNASIMMLGVEIGPPVFHIYSICWRESSYVVWCPLGRVAITRITSSQDPLYHCWYRVFMLVDICSTYWQILLGVWVWIEGGANKWLVTSEKHAIPLVFPWEKHEYRYAITCLSPRKASDASFKNFDLRYSMLITCTFQSRVFVSWIMCDIRSDIILREKTRNVS